MNTSKEKSWVSSAEIIGSNQDVLTEILLRIPAKPLLKFKCVSKQWLSLISDPKFCICHARRQKILNLTPNALLLNKGYSSTPKFQVVPLNDTTKVPSLDFLNVPRVKILQSCNGLLLCSSTYLLKPSEQQWKKSKTEMGFEQVSITLPWYKDYCSSVVNDDDCGYRCFICNATTKQFKRLAFPSHISEGFGPFGVFLNLAFDPLKSPYCKVILLHVLDAMMDKYEIHVYSSKNESWTGRGIPFRWPFTTVISPGVFCNGSIHWCSREATSPYFDVDSEKLNVMPMPRMQNVLYFGESCGHLHMVVTTERSSLPLEFNVLEMASDYSGWSVKYHVDLCSIRTGLPELSWHHGQITGAYSVLSIIQAGREEESTIVLFLNGVAISYNPCKGTSNKLCNLKPSPRDGRELVYEGCNAYQYFETLVCV